MKHHEFQWALPRLSQVENGRKRHRRGTNGAKLIRPWLRALPPGGPQRGSGRPAGDRRRSGSTPLHNAAYNGYSELVPVLLAAGPGGPRPFSHHPFSPRALRTPPITRPEHTLSTPPMRENTRAHSGCVERCAVMSALWGSLTPSLKDPPAAVIGWVGTEVTEVRTPPSRLLVVGGRVCGSVWRELTWAPSSNRCSLELAPISMHLYSLTLPSLALPWLPK